jgi:hypothetical protein
MIRPLPARRPNGRFKAGRKKPASARGNGDACFVCGQPMGELSLGGHTVIGCNHTGTPFSNAPAPDARDAWGSFG